MKQSVNIYNVVEIAKLLKNIELSQLQGKSYQVQFLLNSFKTAFHEFKKPMPEYSPPIDELDNQLKNLITATQALFDYLSPELREDILQKVAHKNSKECLK